MSKIIKTFAHHSPTSQGLDDIRKIRQAYSSLCELLKQTVHTSRELSIALTHLEDSATWAIKGRVVNDPDSKVEDTLPVPEIKPADDAGRWKDNDDGPFLGNG